jgi:hypothetical protein
MGDEKTATEIVALLMDPNHTSDAWRASYRELESRVGQYQAGRMVQDALKKRQQDGDDRQKSDVQPRQTRAQERVLAAFIPQLEPHKGASKNRRFPSPCKSDSRVSRSERRRLAWDSFVKPQGSRRPYDDRGGGRQSASSAAL